MAKYTHYVVMPFAGYINAMIHSDKEDLTPDEIADAVAQDCNRLDLHVGKDRTQADDFTAPEIGEWSPHAHLVRGNVCYAHHTEAHVDYTDEDE